MLKHPGSRRDADGTLVGLREDDALCAGFATVNAHTWLLVGGIKRDQRDASDRRLRLSADRILRLLSSVPVGYYKAGVAVICEVRLELCPGINPTCVRFSERERPVEHRLLHFG